MTLPKQLYLYINETLLRTAVINLVKNAYVHSAEGGAVDVVLNDRCFVVSNEGNEPLDGNHVFDRFYTRTSREGSTGLGLAIVKAVAEHYAHGVEYAYADGRHIFTVRFAR